MKTEYNSEEDKRFLEECFNNAIMNTSTILLTFGLDAVKEMNMVEYWHKQLRLRRKCFEYLGEKDTRHDLLEKLEEEIKSHKNVSRIGKYIKEV